MMKNTSTFLVMLLFAIIAFSTLNSQEKGYETVKIGKQIWMLHNLDLEHYSNGEEIPYATNAAEWVEYGSQGIGAWCYYDFNPENGTVYGKLYNWFAVIDQRGLAPEGWRIPAEEDWVELEISIGMSYEDAIDCCWRGEPAAAKLAGNRILWQSGEMTDNKHFGESGFMGLPGGYINQHGSFIGKTQLAGHFWATTTDTERNAWARYLYYRYPEVGKYSSNKRNGYSVRCLMVK